MVDEKKTVTFVQSIGWLYIYLICRREPLDATKASIMAVKT